MISTQHYVIYVCCFQTAFRPLSACFHESVVRWCQMHCFQSRWRHHLWNRTLASSSHFCATDWALAMPTTGALVTPHDSHILFCVFLSHQIQVPTDSIERLSERLFERRVKRLIRFWLGLPGSPGEMVLSFKFCKCFVVYFTSVAKCSFQHLCSLL